ncbi:MAG: putative esterase [Myxococcales bacterium]|nr:putative esterase [Myxococcales bacterium]
MRVDVITHQSSLLAGNPLGDPTERELIVLMPPSYDATARRYPVVLLLPGYGGTGWQLAFNRSAWQIPFPRRIGDAMRAGRVREAILVLPDCFTRYGGSQYVDSPAIGPYQSYLCDELLPFVDRTFRTIPRREARAVIGKSSGGYGAMVMGMLRPDVVSAVGSHAGDGALEISYLRDLSTTVLTLEKRGGLEAFLRWFEEQPQKGQSSFDVMSHLCCAAAWSPKPHGPYSFGHGFDFPLNLLTAAVRDDVWARWLAHDPVRMLDAPHHRAALSQMSAIYLDAGIADEHNLQLATRQLASRLAHHSLPYTHEEFEGGHYNTQHRYERSLSVLTAALSA